MGGFSGAEGIQCLNDTKDGHTYEKNAIVEALRSKGYSPITNQPMGNQAGALIECKVM